jgi:hypothetical protein
MMAGVVARSSVVPPTDALAGVEARYWRVRITQPQGGLYSSIGEVFLVGTDGDFDATGRTYAWSASIGGAYNGNYAFDGNVNGSNYWAVTSGGLPAWAQVDMGSPVRVVQVDIGMSTSAGQAECPKAFDIEYSADGVLWSVAATFSGLDQETWTLGVRRQFLL